MRVGGKTIHTGIKLQYGEVLFWKGIVDNENGKNIVGCSLLLPRYGGPDDIRIPTELFEEAEEWFGSKWFEDVQNDY